MHVQHHNETWKDSDMLLPNTRYVYGMEKYIKKLLFFKLNEPLQSCIFPEVTSYKIATLSIWRKLLVMS